MPLYTFGGTPADVLTDSAGNVVPDYPVLVKVAGTGAVVTALFEEDGTTPIATLRSNSTDSSAPGAIRTFKAADVAEIQYEYLDASGQPVRWYQVGREVASGALQTAQQALDAASSKLDLETTDPQEAAGPVTFNGAVTFDQPITAPNLNDQSAVRWFAVTGATGNGIADDRAAIQAQLDAAHTAGGGIVYIPPGRTYGVSTFLVVYDNTTIWAYGATLKAIGTGAGLLRNFLSTETFSGYAGHSHIQVLGGIWDGNASDGSTGTVTAETDVLNFVHCSDTTVKDATVRNVSSAHALEFNSTDGAKAINCRFEGYRDNSGTSARQFSEAIQIDIAKSGSSSIGSFDNTASKNVLVMGCYFGPSSRLGVFGRAVGSHTVSAGVTFDNIQVIGNRIDGTLREGIYGYGWRRAVIADNVITGTGYSGVQVTQPDPATTAITQHTITVRGNTIEGAGTDSGIRVLGYATSKITGVAVTGNVIRSITGNAVHCEHCSAPNISGNQVDTTTSTGIYAHYSDAATITGNVIRAAGSNALNASGSVSVTIAGNTVDGTSSNFGVFIGQGADGSTNATDATITGNVIRSPASSGIRLSTNATGCLVVGNSVRKLTGSASSALSMAASATGCSVLNNDFSGNNWGASTAMSVSTAAPVTGPGGMTALPGSNLVDLDVVPQSALEAALRPSGRYETTSRLRLGTSSTPTSGTLYLVPIWLPKGLIISSITFVSGGTAAGTPVNWWFTLHDSSRKALARTADQLTAAWAANTVKTLAIAQTTAGTASSYTTTYAGLHYLGFMIKATTNPSLISEGSNPDVVAQVSPGFGGTDTGLSTPPTVSGAGFTAGAFGAGSGILAYGYVS
ncbi:right-handed parallel beta-helix repeat-containing protein [Streptomyces sp. NPDC051636]|uniref:right-handed parallel beta-helix repeat-containing protein n=1 Tax=Streptomyces sp. NPDC051636 TaxID=3365663 RepID=UPI003791C8B6